MKTMSAGLKAHFASETTTITTCIAMVLNWRDIPVTSISQANPAVVTTTYDHALVDGQFIAFTDVVGMTEVNEDAHTQPWKFYVVTVLTDTTFELNGIDSTGFTAYTSGGIIHEILAFTDLNEDLTLDGIDYSATSSFSNSSIQSEGSMAVDNLELEGVISNLANDISAENIIAGRFDMAELRMFQVNYEDLSMGRVWLRRGWVGGVKVEDNKYIFEFRGMMDMLQQQTLELYTPDCRFDLGDSRCKFLMTGNTASPVTPATGTGSITSITDNRVFHDTTRTEGDNFFQFGELIFTSGSNTGLSKEVKVYTFVSSEIEVIIAFPFNIEVGDEYIIKTGCDKTFLACKNKFNNVLNFGGFPYLPGEDRLLEVTVPKQPSINPT